MKKLVSSLAFSCAFIVFAIHLFLGVRLMTALFRAMIVFSGIYLIGLIAAIFIGVAYFSSRETPMAKRADQKVKEAR